MDMAASASTGDGAKNSVIKYIPDKVLEKIFGYLDFQGLVSVCCVSDYWQTVAKKPQLWSHAQYRVQPGNEIRRIVSILKSYPMLRHIKIHYSVHDFMLLLEVIIRHCNDLRSIDISDVEGVCISSDVLKNLFKKFPNIESFSEAMPRMNVQQHIQLLGTCEHLQRIVLLGNSISYLDLKPLADGCPNLIHLHIQYVRVSGENASYFVEKKKHGLKSFMLHTGGFLSETTPVFYDCHQLERISFNFNYSSYQTKFALQSLSSSLNLKGLGLKWCNDASPDNLIKLFKAKLSTSLIELDLSYYTKIDEVFCIEIRNCFPNIRKLLLNGCFKTHQRGLDELLKLEKLEHLELSRISFSTAWYDQLLRCKHLKHLKLARCNLEDAHFCKIVESLQLEYLNLSGCRVLASSFLLMVPKCKSLRDLVLYYTHLSKEDENIRKLKSEMPCTFISTDRWVF